MKYYRTAVTALILAAIPVLGSVDPANAKGHLRAGEAIYNQTCVACHGAKGKGEVPGAPDFSRKDGVLAQSEKILFKHLHDGFQSHGSPIAMPAKGGNEDLSDKDLRNVLHYLHVKFHHLSQKWGLSS